MTASTSPIRRVTPWIPAAILCAMLVMSALLGRGPLGPDAHAANTISVTGLVNKIVYLDASGCSAPSAVQIGDLVPGDPWKQTTTDCALLFGSSNSALGADLTVLENVSAAPAPPGAMKCADVTCTGGSFDQQLDDVAANSIPPIASASAFGMTLQGTSGVAAGVWNVGRANPVATAATACNTAAIGDGTCAFRFGASASATDGPGVYQAQVDFAVLAR